MNVLIIDDDSEDASLFCEALIETFPGSKCCSIHSCVKIRQTLSEVNPDIIFMDAHLYPTNGKECLKLLNELVDRDKVRIIIHSGSLSPTECNEFRKLGVDDIIFKPVSYQELKSNVISTIEKYVEDYHR